MIVVLHFGVLSSPLGEEVWGSDDQKKVYIKSSLPFKNTELRTVM